MHINGQTFANHVGLLQSIPHHIILQRTDHYKTMASCVFSLSHLWFLAWRNCWGLPYKDMRQLKQGRENLAVITVLLQMFKLLLLMAILLIIVATAI